MSDYHILRQSTNKKNVQVVFHIPVPSQGSNEAGISWQNAVRIDLFRKDEAGNEIAPFSVLPTYHPQNYPAGIESAEETQISVGEIVELVKTVNFSSINLTDAQRLAEIEADFTATKTDLIAEKQIELAWTGKRDDVGG